MRLTSCALVTGVQTCALPIFPEHDVAHRVVVAGVVLDPERVVAGGGGLDLRQAPAAGLVEAHEVGVRRQHPGHGGAEAVQAGAARDVGVRHGDVARDRTAHRSEEHTSELQSLMRTSYAAFCFK